MDDVCPDRRTTLVMDAGRYVGPTLCSMLAAQGGALVLHGAAPGQADDLRRAGAEVLEVGVESVPHHGPGSVGTTAGATSLVEQAVAAFGGVDAALVRSPHYLDGPLDRVTAHDLAAVRWNFDITFSMLTALTATMRRAGAGSVVVCTSAYAARPDADHPVYAAVRAAETALVRAVALASAPDGVALNAVGSAYLKFPEFHGGWHDGLEVLGQETPRGHLGTMSELAEVCALLLSGRVGHLIGQLITVDGGWS